jgi:hypothetical protein
MSNCNNSKCKCDPCECDPCNCGQNTDDYKKCPFNYEKCPLMKDYKMYIQKFDDLEYKFAVVLEKLDAIQAQLNKMDSDVIYDIE